MPRTALLALVLTAPLAAGAQTLFKCVGRDGKVSYQAEPCAAQARQSTIAKPQPLLSGESGDAPMAADLEPFVNTVSDFEGCAATVPGFAGKHGGAYAEWKKRNAAANARYRIDGEAQRRVRESVEQARHRDRNAKREERQQDAAHCEKVVAHGLAPKNH